MDKAVPADAAILLDFIRLIEGCGTSRVLYDVIYGYNTTDSPDKFYFTGLSIRF